MRWPWRSHDAEPESSPGADAGPRAHTPATRDTWRSLAPLQRTTHEHTSACHLDSFPSTLSTRQDPRFLEPLGHDVVPDAPAGEVADLARPVVRSHPDPSMGPAVPPPVQRAVQRALEPTAAAPTAAAEPEPQGEPIPAPTLGIADPSFSVAPSRPPTAASDAALPPPPPLQRATEQQAAPAPGAQLPPRPPAPPTLPVQPARELPVVSRTMAAPATSDPSHGTLPDPVPHPVPAVAMPLSTPGRVEHPVQRAVQQAVQHPVQRAVQQAAESRVPDAPDRPTPPEAPHVAPAVVPDPGPDPHSVDLLGDRPIEVDTTSAPPPPGQPVQRAVATPGTDQGRPSAARLQVQRSDPAISSPAPAPDDSPTLPAPTLLWPRAAAPTPVGPGVRPVPAPPLQVQAFRSGPGPASQPVPRSAQAEPLVQRVVAQPPSPHETSRTPSLPEPAVTPGPVPVVVSRVPAPPTSSSRVAAGVQRSEGTATGSRPALLPAAGHVTALQPSLQATLQRTSTYDAAPSGPGPTAGPAIRSLPLQRMFSGVASRSRAVDLPLRSSVPSVTTAPSDGRGGAAEESVSAAVTWQAAVPTVHRAEAGDAEGAAVATSPDAAEPSAAGVATALASTSPPPAKPGGQDLDELARRLYGPMSAMLRAEFWLDRERSGRSLT